VLKKLAATGAVAFATAGVLMTSSPAFAGGNDTDGEGGVLSGNQFIEPISIPIDICGNAVAIIGLASARCEGGASVGIHGH
jgi:hypothetical protein